MSETLASVDVIFSSSKLFLFFLEHLKHALRHQESADRGGDGHERRVQRRRHVPHHVIANEDGKHENSKVLDGRVNHRWLLAGLVRCFVLPPTRLWVLGYPAVSADHRGIRGTPPQYRRPC